MSSARWIFQAISTYYYWNTTNETMRGHIANQITYEIQLNILKISLANDFDNLTIFLEEEIKWWLVRFVNDNEYYMTSVQESRSEWKSIEDDFFSLQVKEDITISLLKDCIENYLKDALNAITNYP